MAFLLTSAFLLAIAYPMSGMTAAVWVLAASQLLLLLREIRTRQVTGAGTFIFMSFLFFGMRPIYILIEKDYVLFTRLFLLRVDLEVITGAMWWASVALWCFAAAAFWVPRLHAKYFRSRSQRSKSSLRLPALASETVVWLIGLQLVTVPIMVFLASAGNLYRTGFGAYLYDLPVLLQSVHVFAVVVLFERFLSLRNPGSIFSLAVSGILLLGFTWLMRDVTNFRTFYLTGVLVSFIALLHVLKLRVGYGWIILPVVALQPLFAYLGGVRSLANEEIVEETIIEEAVPDANLGQAYWNFYRHNGDMNIFDTFVAAKQTEPRFKPYAWSWLYVPLHFIPRAIWKGKPEKGVTMDTDFTRGAPYSPGIAGFFLRDGGLWWMLACMALLGYLVSYADWWALTLPRGYLRCCLIGVLAVNAMLLSRFFLWQYFYQVLYYVIPILVLSWLVTRASGKSTASRRRSHRPHRASAAHVGA